MLFADQLRGAHGTGIIYNQGNKIKTLKAPVASSDFVNDKAYDKAESEIFQDRKSTRLNSSHVLRSRMPSSA